MFLYGHSLNLYSEVLTMCVSNIYRNLDTHCERVIIQVSN